jgi:ketosteroid isomerase-like protein
MTRFQLTGAAMAVLVAGSLGACNKMGPATPAADTAKISDAVKADVARLATDFNAHDTTKVVSHDAPGVVQMYHGAPNVVGVDADTEGSKAFFKTNPDTKVSVADATVDVAASGDMAVYRSTFTLTYTDPKTHKPTTDTGNYLAGYRAQPDGSWKIAWSVVSDTPPAAADRKS